MSDPTLISPVTFNDPSTCNFALGSVVPIPTLPPAGFIFIGPVSNSLVTPCTKGLYYKMY